MDGANPITMGGKNSGKAVGGSTVHFAMVSLRFRPEWFKSRSALGYGADWPLDWREMWHYYTKAEKALSISGPVTLSLGPETPALSLSRPRAERRGGIAGARGGGDGHEMDADAARHRVGAAWPIAALRLSRLLPLRLLHQRQAEPVGDLHSARVARRARKSAIWRWSAGSRWGRTAAPRACTIIARDAGAFRRRAMSSSPAMRSKRRGLLLASANGPIPGRPGQQLRPRRQEPDDAVQSGRVRHDGAGGALEQGAAFARDHRALEL